MHRLPHLLHVCYTGLLLVPALPALAAEHAVVLMYHHFGDDTPPSTSVTLAQFDAHLDYLASNGYRIWPLEKIVTQLRDRQALPDKVVAISIDDAYISVYHQAWPRLRARGWPFTVFVATDPVDQDLRAMMSWAQMREMAAAGVSFANHSRAHEHLIRRRPGEDEAQWRARVRDDLLHAQARLQTELGRTPPQLFAYPYGEYDTALRELVGELGFSAFGQQSGPVSRYADPQALPRYPMAVAFAGLDELRDKLQSRPLPVLRAESDDPLLEPDDTRPLLTLTLQPGGYDPDTLGCYISGQGRVTPQWMDAQQTRLTVRAERPLAVGRSRYNCTAQASDGAGWLWYSQPWILRHPDGSWYRE
ncbi:MAG TPA: polysaccharide deacetylase family protein [Gammaproteobacteria bacterium]|nr:polysaccharide deacetylase family protein [Gammaproteobacteria bacterium]